MYERDTDIGGLSVRPLYADIESKLMIVGSREFYYRVAQGV